MAASQELLWQKTPLIRSSALSAKTGCEVYLKIEVSPYDAYLFALSVFFLPFSPPLFGVI